MSCTKSYGGWTRCLIIVAVALSLSGLGVGIYFIVKSTPASDNAESTAESSTIVNTESTTESSTIVDFWPFLSGKIIRIFLLGSSAIFCIGIPMIFGYLRKFVSDKP